MGKLIKLEGRRFGRLKVIKKADKKRKKKILWVCKCVCGKITVVWGLSLRSGNTHSCGCSRGGKKTHGGSRTRLYRVWAHMKTRCNDIKNRDYKNYGGRGIKVCKAWLNSFTIFRTWALANGYSDNLGIDRINNDKGYSPGNCQFLTRVENARKGNKSWKK